MTQRSLLRTCLDTLEQDYQSLFDLALSLYSEDEHDEIARIITESLKNPIERAYHLASKVKGEEIDEHKLIPDPTVMEEKITNELMPLFSDKNKLQADTILDKIQNDIITNVPKLAKEFSLNLIKPNRGRPSPRMFTFSHFHIELSRSMPVKKNSYEKKYSSFKKQP